MYRKNIIYYECIYLYIFECPKQFVFLLLLLLFTYNKICLTFVYAYSYKLLVNPINTYKKLVFRYDTYDFN